MKIQKSENNLVGIVAICASMMIPIIAVVLIFASAAAWILVPIAICLTVMACFVGILEIIRIKITGGKDESTTFES